MNMFYLFLLNVIVELEISKANINSKNARYLNEYVAYLFQLEIS